MRSCVADNSDHCTKLCNDSLKNIISTVEARKACARQELNGIIEQQESAIESCNKVMMSTRRKRGILLEAIDIDRSSRKPKILVQSHLMAISLGSKGSETMDVGIANFILRNGLPPSLREFPNLKLLTEGGNHFPNWYEPLSRKLSAGTLLDANFTAISNEIDS